jgi:ferritin-like metal-binding protein YciE
LRTVPDVPSRLFADTRNNRAASRLAQYHQPNIGASLIAWASQPGRNDCAAIQRKPLDEEKATDQNIRAAS